MNTQNTESIPVVIEAAISALSVGSAPPDADTMIEDAKKCLAAGATLIHHHHNTGLKKSEAIEQITRVGKEIVTAYSDAIVYPDYIYEKTIADKYAYTQSLADEGALSMLGLDPGLTLYASLNDDGLPWQSVTGGTKYHEAHEVVELANRLNVPLSLGVFEPGHLRWITSYAAAGKFPKGSMVKLYFAEDGEYQIGTRRVKSSSFGLPPIKGALDVYLSMMEGIQMPWIVSVFGDVLVDTDFAQYALERGGHIRVGVEDFFNLSDMTNEETVVAAIDLVNKVGRPVAQGHEARDTLINQSGVSAA